MEKDHPLSLRSTSLSNPNGSTVTFNDGSGSSWTLLCEKVNPLFQGKGLKGSIDELNSLLRKHHLENGHIQVKSEIMILFQSGVKSLYSKLSNILAVITPTEEGDTIYLTRLGDIWFYYHNTTILFLEAGNLKF